MPTTTQSGLVAERGCCVGQVEDLVANKVPREWVFCLRTSTPPTMSDHEEDSGDFPSEYKEESNESLIGAHRAESTLQYKSKKWNHNKIPPLFDGSTSWFACEELIEDWLDLTSARRNKTKTSTEESTCRRSRNVQGTKPRISESNRWSKAFQEYVETSLLKKMVKWIGRISLSLQRLTDAWMDNLPMPSMNEEQRQSQYLSDVAQESAERLTRGVTALDPNTPENRES